MKIAFFLISITFSVQILFSQSVLRLNPEEIEFEDEFSRFEQVFLVNDGNQPLIMLDITENDSLYLIRFTPAQQLPFTINPGDSLAMEIVLAGYFYLDPDDALDEIFITSNDPNSPTSLEIEIDFFDPDVEGTIAGQITGNALPLEDARIYFFYEGIYLIDSTLTDNQGRYSKLLPEGLYTLAANHPDFYPRYFDDRIDPFFADTLFLEENSLIQADLNLPPRIDTGLSVSGNIFDDLSPGGDPVPLDRGIVIVRRGTHTPSKMKSNPFNLVNNGTYIGFIQPDGSYTVENIVDSGFYYVSGKSDYFLPGFYNTADSVALFWPEADSLVIDTNISNINIFLSRDASVGAGSVAGALAISNFSTDDEDDFVRTTIFAQSLADGSLTAFGEVRSDGSFQIANLPVGSYELIIHQIGRPIFNFGPIDISLLNPSISNLVIPLGTTSIRETGQILLNPLTLWPNYPNPFNPQTTISFELSRVEQVQVTVFNSLGQRVALLADDQFGPGAHQLTFNGERLSSGTFLIVLRTSTYLLSQKVTLLK